MRIRRIEENSKMIAGKKSFSNATLNFFLMTEKNIFAKIKKTLDDDCLISYI